MRDIYRKRPLSKRPRMSVADRAKQFGAFDPLTGFSQAIRLKEIEMEQLLEEETVHIKETDE